LPASIELFPLEGRTVRMTGWILPGNNFKPKGDSEVVQSTCAAHLVPAIRRDIVIDHRIRGQQAARMRDYKEAYRLFGLAVILDPADCDTYVDRAYVHASRGDRASADTDLAVLEKSECSNPHQANHLLLQDVGKVFEQQGWRDGALTIYRTALAVCEKRDYSDLCRDGILENIRRVSEPKQGGKR
jgi:regulator of sirC expression with transglutaminase-like and TPR domain